MKPLVITLAILAFTAAALAAPADPIDDKNATSSTAATTETTTTATTALPVSAKAGSPTLAPFAPEARSDVGGLRQKPKATLKGKPIGKAWSKAKRKKLELPQKRVQVPKKVRRPPLPKKQAPAKQVEPQRRDSPGYAAPSYQAPQREVIIEQAGPSKVFGWVGHGNGYNAPHNLQNPFPANLPKWILENNKIFEAGLLYPGKPQAQAPSYSPPPPPPASYSPPVEAPAEVGYSAPSAPSSYNVPVIPSSASYNSPAAEQPTYGAPAEPVYTPPAATYEQPTYAEPLPTYAEPQPTYDVQAPVASYDAVAAAPISPSYSTVQTQPNYVPVDASGAAVVSASYSSVDTSSNYNAPDVSALPPPFYGVSPSVSYKAAEPASSYSAAAPAASYVVTSAPVANYGAAAPEATYQAVAPVSNYGAAAPEATYQAAAPEATYQAAAPVSNYGAAAPEATYQAAAPEATYQAAAPVANYGAAAPVTNYEAAAPQASYGTIVQIPAYETPAAPADTSYGAPVANEAPAPLPNYQAEPIPVNYNEPADDDQSIYNLYTPPAQQPEYQASASYSVPSIYDLGKPGNFPSYNNNNNLPLSDELAQPLDSSYDAPQGVYEVPIKVEETYQSPASDPKSPEVFYIFYENQDGAQAEQGYASPPPEANQFSPPRDIQTIYVPPENAVNIPQTFGVDVGTSFGYAGQGQEAEAVRTSGGSSFSFDNPAFNAPQRPIGDTLFRDTVEGGLNNPINKLAINDNIFQDDAQSHANFGIDPRTPLRPIRELLAKSPSKFGDESAVPVDEDIEAAKGESSAAPALLPFGARLKKYQHNNKPHAL